MTQPVDTFVAHFDGETDQPFSTIQGAMTYVESLSNPTGYIGYVPDPKVAPVPLLMYEGGVISMGAETEQYPNEEEWPV